MLRQAIAFFRIEILDLRLLDLFRPRPHDLVPRLEDLLSPLRPFVGGLDGASIGESERGFVVPQLPREFLGRLEERSQRLRGQNRVGGPDGSGNGQCPGQEQKPVLDRHCDVSYGRSFGSHSLTY